MKTALQFVGEIKEKNCSIDDFIERLKRRERRLSYKTAKPMTLQQKIDREKKHRAAAEELRNFRLCYFDIEDILKGILCPNCGGNHVSPAHDNKLNKCLSCHFSFD